MSFGLQGRGNRSRFGEERENGEERGKKDGMVSKQMRFHQNCTEQ